MAGSSGDISYPDYLENTHKHWMWHSTALAAPNDLITYSMTDLLNTATGAGGNPYEGETAYDPIQEIADIDTQFDATKVIIDALDADADWATFVDSVESKLGVLEDINIDDTTKSDTNWEAFLSTATSNLDMLTSIDATDESDISALFNSYFSEVDSKFEDVSAVDLTDTDSIVTNWNAFMTAIKNSLSNFEDIEYQYTMQQVLGALLSAAETALSDSSIDNLVTAFENKKKARFRRDVSQWSASMADINAVHTSSFVIGQALLQNEFAKEIDAFESELKFNLYNTIMTNGINNFLAIYGQRVNSKDNFLGNVNQFQQVFSDTKRLEVEIAQGKNQNSLQGVQTFNQLYQTINALKTQLLTEKNNVTLQGIESVKQLYATILGLQLEKNKTSLGSVSTIAGLHQIVNQLQLNLAALKADIEKNTIVAKGEQAKMDLSIDVNDALWDFEIMMYGANLLASIAGAPAGRKQSDLEKVQSGLSTAASIFATVAAVV